MGVDYKVVQYVWSVKELDALKDRVEDGVDDEMVKKVMETLVKVDGLSEDELREVILYAVMCNDPNDVEFIKNHPELCKQCGWCCKNCDPIIIKPEDIRRLGSFDHLSLHCDDLFKLNIPCGYLVNDKCSVYTSRPDSCRTFPISLKNHTIIVQRSLNCEMIFEFLLYKVLAMCEVINKKRGG